MNEGWVKIYRSICESPVFTDAEALRLWIYILCNAAHKEHDVLYYGKIVHLEKGQFITGRKILAQKFQTSESKVYRKLQLLKRLGNVNIISNNSFSLVTVVNWEKYQDNFESLNNEQTTNEQQANNRRTTDEQQTNTTEECKELKECIKGGEEYACARARACEEAPTPPTPPTLEEIRLFCSERNSSVNPARFYNYNAVRNWKGVTDWRLKLEEWESNEYASEDKAKAEKLSTYMSAGGHGEHLNLDMFDEARGPEKDTGGWVYEV